MITQQKSEKGQALAFIVVGFIVILGFVGLAIDGGRVYSDRRHAQNSSDASSLAGAAAASLALENSHLYYGLFDCKKDDGRLSDAMQVARGNHLFVVDGAVCRLALLRDRSEIRHLGEEPDSPLIDQLHNAMCLWKIEKRSDLVNYLRSHELSDHEPFWKLAQALFEVLPHGEEDWKLISALLGERETLRKEVRRAEPSVQPTQPRLPEM